MPDSDDAVIPLSRFRAALARARRTRRADAILSEPGAELLVPRLPVQELYYAIKEVGLADAQELVALASPEQVRGFVDLDAWERDQLDVDRMRPWIDTLVDAGPNKLKAAIEALDVELVALYLRRQTRVYDLTLGDLPPEESEGTFYPTPDGFFLLDILVAGEEGKSLMRMIDWLYRADLELARKLMMNAKWELDSELEEWSYRWRAGRMSDLGYSEFYEALSIYRYLDPQSVRLDEARSAEPPPDPSASAVSALPVQLATALDESSFFARAFGKVQGDAEIERLQGLLMVLVNKAMAADRVEPGDVEGARRTLERTVGYLGIGLESLSRGDLDRAGVALHQVAVERIFRVGVSLTLQLRKLADTLGKAGAGVRLLDAPFDSLIAALRIQRPQFPRLLDEKAAEGTRPFRTLKDVAVAAASLEEAARIGPAVFASLRLTPVALAAAVQSSTTPPSEIRFGTLVRTAAANLLLGRPPLAVPLRSREARGLRLDGSAREKVHAALPALARWLDEWLSDFGPLTLLQRYSWLK